MTYEPETETTYDNPEAYLAALTPEYLAALELEVSKYKRKATVRKRQVAVRTKEKSSSRRRS